MSKMMLQIDIEQLGIEGYNGDYIHLIEDVETEVYKEVLTHNKIVFYPENLEELNLIQDDIQKIVVEVALKIEEIQEEFENKKVS